jgi:hypothetical protein
VARRLSGKEIPRPGGHPDRGGHPTTEEEATMKRVPQPRHTTIRFTGPDGVTWQGDGDGFAAAARDLRRRHRVGRPAEAQGQSGGEARWRLTPAGEAYLAGLRDGEAGR